MPDVLVVGGGPAGSTLGGLLALRGRRVHLVDRRRFPRPKPCGECLNPGAVDALRRLGLLEVVEALDPAPLTGWRLREPDGAAAVGAFGPAGDGLAVDRARLDHALLAEARRRGARIEEGVHVVEAIPGGRGSLPVVRTVEADGSRGVRHARLVIGADGLRSSVAGGVGPPARPPRRAKLSLTFRLRGRGPARDRGLLVLGEHTVGLAPVSSRSPLWNGTVVVDSDVHGREVAADPGAFFMERLRVADLGWTEGPEVVDGPWASGPFDRPRRRVVAEGLLLVGDAAGYYDPLTGQGIYRALRSAELAVPVIEDALEVTPAGEPVPALLLREYPERLRAERAPGLRVQRLVEETVSRPRPRRWALACLRRSPPSLGALIRVTGDAAPARSLLRPEAWLPLLLPKSGRSAAGPNTGLRRGDGIGGEAGGRTRHGTGTRSGHGMSTGSGHGMSTGPDHGSDMRTGNGTEAEHAHGG